MSALKTTYVWGSALVKSTSDNEGWINTTVHGQHRGARQKFSKKHVGHSVIGGHLRARDTAGSYKMKSWVTEGVFISIWLQGFSHSKQTVGVKPTFEHTRMLNIQGCWNYTLANILKMISRHNVMIIVFGIEGWALLWLIVLKYQCQFGEISLSCF